jgi:hypothetical protein
MSTPSPGLLAAAALAPTSVFFVAGAVPMPMLKETRGAELE